MTSEKNRVTGSQPTRRQVLGAGLSAAALAMLGRLPAPGQTGQTSNRPPNFVFIYADDAGYGDLGCYGNKLIKTPNLDRMAQEGMKFTSFYSCAAVCTPSRVGLLTGRYQVRSGLINVLNSNAKVGLGDSEITLAQALKPQGYTSAIIGKWHLGHLPQFLPTRHGFDYYFGIPYSNDMKPHPILRNEDVIDPDPPFATLTQRYTTEAIQFLENHKDKPFFLYLAHSMPHVPIDASANFRGKSAGGLYGDVIEELDWSTGQILQTLKRLGLDENTLVIFSSDNGPWLVKKEHGGTAGPLRAGKGTTFEGGVREPCIARWPGKIKPGSVEDRPAIMLDWFPTFVKLAGGQVPTDRIIDGKDIAPVLLGTAKRQDEEFFFYVGWNLQSHRSGPWKLKLPLVPRRPATQAATRPATQPEGHGLLLFNLDADPGETTNLADQHPEIVARLKRQIAEFQKTVTTTQPTEGTEP